MSHILSQIDLEEEIMRAIYQDDISEGSSLDNIKGYLSTALNQMPDFENIQSSLNNAVDKGLLSKLDNGRYKINQTAGSVEDDIQDPNSVRIKYLKELIKEANEIKEAAISAEEAIEDAYNVITELDSKLTIGQAKIRKTSGCVEETTKVLNRASKQILSGSNKEDANSISKEFMLKTADDIKEVAKSTEEVIEDVNIVIKKLLSKLTSGETKIKQIKVHIEETTKVTNSTSKQFSLVPSNEKDESGETS